MIHPKLHRSLTSRRSLRLLSGLVVAVILGCTMVVSGRFHLGAAQACTATPNSSQGTVTQTINVTQAGTYYVWSRLQAPDTTNNSFYLQIDGGCAINVGDSSSIPANTWTWVNYQDGSANSVTSVNLTAGSHQIVMTGREPGVRVDRLLFLSDQTCIPTSTGDNCTTSSGGGDTTQPTVSLSTPANGATVSGTTTTTATATDNVAVASVQFKVDGTNAGSPDTVSPYTYAWDTTKVANGTHTLTAVATDTSGNTATSAVTVTVNNAIATSNNHYEYVFNDGPSGDVATVSVYDIDNNFTKVDSFVIPGNDRGIRGVNVDPASHRLFVSYGGDGGGNGNGSVLAYDLVTKQQVWNVNLGVGIDSPALSHDGKLLYQPSGEIASNGDWNIMDTSNGSITSTLHTNSCGPHNTVLSADGSTLLLGGRNCNQLGIYNTSTKAVTYAGPMSSGVRPLTIDASDTFAYTTASSFDGFQVSNIKTGKVLFTTSFGSIPSGFPYTTASHGISLSPDSKQVYVIDAVHLMAQVYDVSGVANGVAPSLVASIPISGLSGNETGCVYDCGKDGWIRHTLDGRFVLVGDSGDVISTATHQKVASVSTLANTRKYLEVDWKNGVPVATSNRYGIGYTSSQPADTTPPTVPSGLTAAASSTTQVNLTWNASSDNVGVTSYHIYRNGSTTPLATVTAPITSYSDKTVVANTTYSYTVSALDAASNQSTQSTVANVTTPANADTTVPSVSLTAPVNGATVSGTAVIAATATDNVGVSKVEFYVKGTLLATDTSSPYTTSWDTGPVSNGSYTIQAKAYDAAGNAGTSSLITVTVKNADTTPPTAPTWITHTAASPTQVNLAWNASSDNVGVANYYVERNGAVIATLAGTSYSDTTVSASTTYSYNIVAVDAGGNASTSSSASVTTPALPDTTPPPAPTQLTAIATSPNQVNLNWQASSDPSGIKGYMIYRNGVKLTATPVQGTSYGDSTASASTTYNYTVTAVDGAGLESSSSNAITVTTPTVVSNGIIGKNTIGGYSDQFLDGRKRVNGYSISQSTTVSKLNIYLTRTGTTGQQVMKGIIYADANGKPGALITASKQLTFYSTQSTGWYSLPLSNSVTLLPGKYWIGIWTGDSNHIAGFRWSYYGNSRAYNKNLYDNSSSLPTNPFGSFTLDNEQMSIYASNN